MKKRRILLVPFLLGMLLLLVGCDSDDPCLDTIEPQKEINFRISYQGPLSDPGDIWFVGFTSEKQYCEGDITGKFNYSEEANAFTLWQVSWPGYLTYKFNNSQDKVTITCSVYPDPVTFVSDWFDNRVYTYDMVTPGVDVLVEFTQN